MPRMGLAEIPWRVSGDEGSMGMGWKKANNFRFGCSSTEDHTLQTAQIWMPAALNRPKPYGIYVASGLVGGMGCAGGDKGSLSRSVTSTRSDRPALRSGVKLL